MLPEHGATIAATLLSLVEMAINTPRCRRRTPGPQIHESGGPSPDFRRLNVSCFLPLSGCYPRRSRLGGGGVSKRDAPHRSRQASHPPPVRFGSQAVVRPKPRPSRLGLSELASSQRSTRRNGCPDRFGVQRPCCRLFAESLMVARHGFHSVDFNGTDQRYLDHFYLPVGLHLGRQQRQSLQHKPKWTALCYEACIRPVDPQRRLLVVVCAACAA